MPFTKYFKETAKIYAPDFPTDFRSSWVKAYIKENKLTQKQYQAIVREEVKDNKKLIADVYRRDANREAQQRFRDKNKIVRYIGSINVELVFKRKNDDFTRTEIIPFDKKISKKNLTNEIINTIENNKIEKLAKMDYRDVININVANYTFDIHPVDNTTQLNTLRTIRMRDCKAGLIDGYEKQEWDTNTGKCVFDYIIARYGNIQGFKNVCTYDALQKVFNSNDDEIIEEKDLLVIGVNAIEIERFCKRYKIPMYAIDDNEKTFYQYTPEIPNKKAPAMIYRLSNKHFYPVINRGKIQSITKTTSIINSVDSEMVRDNFKIEDNDDNDDIVDLKNVEFVEDILKLLTNVLNNGVIPEKITIKKKQVVGFDVEKKKFVSNENIDLIRKMCKNMNIEYQGQGVGTLMLECVKQATGNDRLPKSTHNPYVFNTLMKAKKDRVHYGFVNYTTSDLKDCVAWDIVKCYSSCMYSPSEEWMIIDYNDTWEDYDGKLKLGIYYIETKDTMLFKKSGYYTSCIVKKGLKEGIKLKIKKQLIPSKKADKNLFTKIIDKVIEYSKGDTSISKLVINLMSGLLGQSERDASRGKINNDIQQIFQFLDTYYHLGTGIFINKIPDTDYYLYGFNKEQKLNETNIPMYLQVLDESNIKLYDMVKKMGGELVARKVDCAIVRGIDNKEFNDNVWGGYRFCDVPHIAQIEICKSLNFNEDTDWIDYNFNDSDMWEDIYDVFVKKEGLLLQASAGNGKTYTAKEIAKKLDKGVKILAPTNKASLNIKGTTIHKFLKMTSDGYISPKLIRIIKKNYKYIIIDEISMITKELWKRICLLKQETGCIFLLLGDEKQCPPVEDEKIDNYFNHPAVKYLCNYNRNILNVRKRYDEELYDILTNVNEVNTENFPKLETERNICYYNATRIRVNKMWNDNYKKEGDLFIPEDDHNEYTQDMYIYEGLPVIAQKSKRDGDDLLFANSETFVVSNIDDKIITVWNERPNDSGEKEIYIYECPIENFREYFLMNYCSTVHKAQGETIVENYTIYDWDNMSEKLKYTALSRAKSCKQVCFGKLKYVPITRSTFEENIRKKLKGHLEYDMKKGYVNDIKAEDITSLFIKQNGCCIKCDCYMKTCNYQKGDKRQFSIDRIDSKIGHCKGNIQLLCWSCNRSKMNRF